MRVEILCFGTELLRDKVNTNGNAISQKLSALGLETVRITSVGDDSKEVEDSLREAFRRSDLVVTCGGLGPTFDDLTRECVAKVVDKRLNFSKSIQFHIKKRFQMLKRAMPEENNRQAYVVAGAKAILNPVGTAPGQIVPFRSKTIVLLPGPASECLPMMDQSVLPYLKRKLGVSFTKTLVLHIFGHPESEIDEKIAPVVSKNWDTKQVKVIFGI